MTVITVLRDFVLNMPGKAAQEFKKGAEVTVEDSVATHWLVEAYSKVVRVIDEAEAEVEKGVSDIKGKMSKSKSKAKPAPAPKADPEPDPEPDPALESKE